MRLRPPSPLPLVVALVALALLWPGQVAGAAAPQPRPVLVLPVPEARIVDVARLPDQRWLAGHRGIDIAARVDDAVVAPGAGTVAFAGMVAGRPVMTIALDVGVNATLEPVTAALPAGTRVSRGEAVGTVAPTPGHCAPRTCVHWGIRVGPDYQDPLDWLVGFGPVVLLPLP